jgi:hypothetical protein
MTEIDDETREDCRALVEIDDETRENCLPHAYGGRDTHGVPRAHVDIDDVSRIGLTLSPSHSYSRVTEADAGEEAPWEQ